MDNRHVARIFASVAKDLKVDIPVNATQGRIMSASAAATHLDRDSAAEVAVAQTSHSDATAQV